MSDSESEPVTQNVLLNLESTSSFTPHCYIMLFCTFSQSFVLMCDRWHKNSWKMMASWPFIISMNFLWGICIKKKKDEPDVQIYTREQLHVMLWFLYLKTVPGVLSVTPGISSKSFGRTHAAGQKRSCCMKSCLYWDFPTQAEQMHHRKWARKGKH